MKDDDLNRVDDPHDIPMEARKSLHKLPNVNGTGIGPKIVDGERTDEIVLIVFVEDKVEPEELEDSGLVPETLFGIPTDVQKSGTWTAESRTSTSRPVMGGVDVSHVDGTGGSSSAALVDDVGGTVLLTNRHVAATAEEDSTGQDFIQPGGNNADGTGGVIGTVKELGAWSDTVANTTDSALINVDTAAANGNISSELLGAGEVAGFEAANFNDRYVNNGRTTGLTSSMLVAVDVATTITYNAGQVDEFTKYYEGLVSFNPITDPGDSGSLHMRVDPTTRDCYPVALHFAGGSTRSLGIPWSAVTTEHGTLTPANLPGKPPAPSTAGSSRLEVTVPTATSNDTWELPVLITNTGYDHLPERTVTLAKTDGTVVDSRTIQVDYAHSQTVWMDVTSLDAGPQTLDVSADVEDLETVDVEIIDPAPYTVTISVGEDVYGEQLAGVEVFLNGSSLGTTDALGEITTTQYNGDYTITISEDGFEDYTGTVTVYKADTSHTATLAHTYDYVPPADSDWYGQTDVNGRITFDTIKAGNISHELAARAYVTQQNSSNIDTNTTIPIEMVRGTTTSSDGAVGDAPKLNIPGNESFFETTILTPQTDDAFRVPVLVSNAGGAKGSTELAITDETGSRTDSQQIELVSGDAKVTFLSARLLFERSSSVPVRAHITTKDDLETADIYPGAEAEIITGPGRPATAGRPAPATSGRPAPATAGRMRKPDEFAGEDLARVPNGWGVTLVNPGDERLKLEAINKPNPKFAHTALNDWQLTTKADPRLERWTLNCEVYVTFDEELAWVGYCHDADSTSDDQTTTLKGTGPAGDLTQGSIEYSITHSAEWRAIEELMAEFAPEWDTHVVRPDDSTIIYDEEVSGTPLECLESLCKDYGMFFRVDLHRHKSLTVFPPTGVTAASEIPVENFSRSKSSKGYANGVEVTGAQRPDSSGRYRERYVARAEVRRLAADLGVDEEDVEEIIQIRDSTIESDRQAYSRAKAKTKELIQRNELGGTLETPPQMLDPGIAHTMPWDDERAVGPYALAFTTPGATVSLPTTPIHKMRPGGAISLFCKADWSELSDREVRIFGAWDSNGDGFRTAGSQTLTLAMDSTNGSAHATVSAFPESPPPDDEWVAPFWDWEVSRGTTYLRAGHGGEVLDTAEMDGLPAVPIPEQYNNPGEAYFGRWHSDYYIGSLDYVHLFEGPLTPDQREGLSRGESVTAENLLAKYPCNEGPDHEPPTVHDVYGGFHGEASQVLTAGSPQTLHKLDVTADRAKAEFEQRFEPADVLRDVVRKQRRMR